MNSKFFSRWLHLVVVSLLLLGCGDSYDFGGSPHQGYAPFPTRQVVLQFDYSPVLGQIPSSVAGYRIETFSATGELLSTQTVSGRVQQVTLDSVSTQDVVVRVSGLDPSGNPLGYAQLSVPSGSTAVTLRIDVLLSGLAPTARYTAPNGQPAQLAFLVHPQDVDVDGPFAVAVVALDAAGYRVEKATGTVTLSLAGSGGLSGTSSANLVDGVAAFRDLSVNSPGGGKFLTAACPPLGAAKSLTFTVSATESMEPVVEVNLASDRTNSQSVPVVATDSYGNFIVLWSSEGQGVVGQRLTPQGAFLGDRFTLTTEAVFAYDVDALPGGGFVAVWNPTTGATKVQRFGGDNLALGEPFDIDDGSFFARVASTPDGRFVVVTSNSVLVNAQRFATNGQTAGDSIGVNWLEFTEAVYGQYPDVGTDGDGNFVVTWTANRLDGSTAIRACRYDQNGSPTSDPFDVATGIFSGPMYAVSRIGVAPDGRFLIAYLRSDNFSLYRRAYSSTGTGAEPMLVPSTDLDTNYNVEVAMAADGSYALCWERSTVAGDQIFWASFASDGTLRGEVTRAGSSLGSPHQEGGGRIAVSPDNSVALVWSSSNGVTFSAFYSVFPFNTL